MVNKGLAMIVGIIMLIFQYGCDLSEKSPLVRIATNPWPGYELLFVAGNKGFFKEEGLNIKLLQLSSLVDVQRTYNQGRADGMSSTVIEAIIVAALNDEKLKIVLIPDYSFGGDVIISDTDYNSVSDLKGKSIGVETGSLGIVILEKALAKSGLSIEDIKFVNLEQLKMKGMLKQKKIDASVTYPPFSTEILRDNQYKAVFTTREIPEEIIDVITVREDVLLEDPEWANKFQRAWAKALDFMSNNKKEALRMMAEREGVSVEEFEAALSDMYLVEKDEIKSVLGKKSLKDNIESVCKTLVRLKTIEIDCGNIINVVAPVY